MSAPPPSFRKKKSVMAVLETMRPDEHFPFTAMVEIADRCNEACVHCYQVHGQKGELTTDEWKQILDELADMGVLLLTISGGEATLRKDLLEIVEHARKRSFAIKLFTNGLNMTQELASKLGELGVMEVQISLYSHDPAIHDGVTCVPGSFEKTVAAARHLGEAGVAVLLKTPLMSMNVDGIDEYVALIESVGASYQFDPTLDPREDGDATPEQYRIDDAEYLAVLRHPTLAADISTLRRTSEQSVCGACSGHVHIEANGELRPCTTLQVPVGHALRDGVRESWEKDPNGTQIRHLKWGDLPGCRDCDLRHRCVRCFATARVEGDDALAPYATACHTARLNHEVAFGEVPRITALERPDIELGPYREVGDHTFVTMKGELTADDLARRQSHHWLRAPEKLVQIRKRSRSPDASTTRRAD